MIKKNTKKDSGFVALMSAVIVSVILILIASNSSFTGFYSRFNVLDSEFKERSSALADACLDEALLGFIQNPSYAGNTSAQIGPDFCYISPITTNGSQKVFKTRGVYSNAYTNFKVTIDGTTFALISVEEVPNL